MATDFATMEYDPVTGTTKTKKKDPPTVPGIGEVGAPTQQAGQQAPYLNTNEANQGYLPYKPQPAPQGGALDKGNAAVMGAAQTAAMSPQSSQGMQDQTTQMTQKLMTDPNMGRDWSGYNTSQMSKFDADRASALKEYKEANAGMGGSGNVQQNLINMALGQNLDRGILENELEQQAYEKSLENYLNAIGEGREQGQYLDTAQQNYINNLLNARAAYEQERAQTSAQGFQAGEAEKERAFTSGEAGKTRAFTAIESALDRALTKEVEAGRITQQDKELAQQASQFGDELEFKRWATEAGFSEEAANRAWQTNERVSTQEFTAGQATEERMFTASQADLDRELTREVEGGRLSIQEKELAQNAMQFDNELDYKRWATQAGLDDATANRIWQSSESAKDRMHDERMQNLSNAFAEKGLKMTSILNNLENLPPETAAAVLRQIAIEAGVTYTDEAGQTQQGFKGFSPEDIEKIRTEDATTTANEILSGNIDYKTLTGADDPVYQALLNSNQIPTSVGNKYTIEAKGINNDRYAFPELEKSLTNKSPIKLDGKVYVVTSYKVDKNAGDNTTVYTLVNVIDSKDTKNIKAG